MEGVSDGEEEVVISKAAVVPVPQTPKEPPLPMVPTYFTVETLSRNGSRIALTQAPSPHNAPQKLPESPQTVPSEITPGVSREPSAASIPIPPKAEDAPPIPPPKDDKYSSRNPVNGDDDDAASIKSSKSAKSRMSIVSAARRRSHRVSQNSLRLNHPKPNDAPPVPNLPALTRSTSKPNRFSTNLLSTKSFRASRLFSTNSSSSAASHSNTHQPNGNLPSNSSARQSNGSTVKSTSSRSSPVTSPLEYIPYDPPSQMDTRRQRTSLEDLHIVDSPTSDRFPRGVTADDIYVHRRRGSIADPAPPNLNRLSRRVSTNDFNPLGHGSSSQGTFLALMHLW